MLDNHEVTKADALRFVCRDPVFADDPVHGAWWPRSRNLEDELPALLRALDLGGHEVTRVMFGTRGWESSPRQIAYAGRVVRLVGYYSQSAHSIVLVDTTGVRQLNLLVIPPDTVDEVASAALAMAGRDGGTERLNEILPIG